MCLLVDQTSFLSREEQGHGRAGGAQELCPIPHASWATWMDPQYSPTRPLPTVPTSGIDKQRWKAGKAASVLESRYFGCSPITIMYPAWVRCCTSSLDRYVSGSQNMMTPPINLNRNCLSGRTCLHRCSTEALGFPRAALDLSRCKWLSIPSGRSSSSSFHVELGGCLAIRSCLSRSDKQATMTNKILQCRRDAGEFAEPK